MKKPAEPHGKGMPGRDRHAWVTVAEQAIYQLVDTALAVPHVELESRLFDTGWSQNGGKPITFFPHILDEARNNLITGGNIHVIEHHTKGAATAELYVPSDTYKRTTAVERAVKRKAMLYARFKRASQTFGEAGESVLRGSLAEAMPHGYLAIEPGFAEVRRLAGVTFAGALDSGAWLTLKDQLGLPLPHHAMLIEMKNRRLTIYPRHKEIHQLLAKAAHFQNQHPDLPVVPLLVCRRAHDRLFWMAKDLGFLVHATRRHFMTLPKAMELRHVEQIREELGLADLRVLTPDTTHRIIDMFRSTVPRQAHATAARWASVGRHLAPHYTALRSEAISERQRTELLEVLRTEAGQLLDAAAIPEEERILAWALEEGDYFSEPDIDYEEYRPSR